MICENNINPNCRSHKAVLGDSHTHLRTASGCFYAPQAGFNGCDCGHIAWEAKTIYFGSFLIKLPDLVLEGL